MPRLVSFLREFVFDHQYILTIPDVLAIKDKLTKEQICLIDFIATSYDIFDLIEDAYLTFPKMMTIQERYG